MKEDRYCPYWRPSSGPLRDHRRNATPFGVSTSVAWPARLLEHLSALWARAVAHVKEHRAASELDRVNDHLLRDIGLDRVRVRSGVDRAATVAMRLR